MKPLELEPGAGEHTLTARQAMVLTWIRLHIATHQRPPTTREIAAHFGWKGQSGAWSHIKALEAKGRITRAAPSTTQILPVVRSRCIRVLGAQLEWREDGEPSRAELLHELELARTALKEFA